jgi:hypothetical protein
MPVALQRLASRLFPGIVDKNLAIDRRHRRRRCAAAGPADRTRTLRRPGPVATAHLASFAHGIVLRTVCALHHRHQAAVADVTTVLHAVELDPLRTTS